MTIKTLLRNFDKKKDKQLLEESEKDAFEISFPGVYISMSVLIEDFHFCLDNNQIEVYVLETEEEESIGIIVLGTEYFASIAIGYISSIYVSPEHRGNAYSELLLNQAKKYFKNIGIDYMKLEVTASNDVAIGAYEKYGFVNTRLTMEIKL